MVTPFKLSGDIDIANADPIGAQLHDRMTASATVFAEAQRKARLLREQAESLEAIGDTFHDEQDYKTALAVDRIVRQMRQLSASIVTDARRPEARPAD